MRQFNGFAAVMLLLSVCDFAAAAATEEDTGMKWPGGPASAVLVGIVIGVIIRSVIAHKRRG